MQTRLMTAADLAAGLELCRMAGWNQLERDWRLFLQNGRAFVAEIDGKVVGSSATIRYGSDLAWISMVLVNPDYRGQGLGRKLLEIAFDDVSDVKCVKLDATPEGRRIYVHYGFQDEFRLCRMVGSGEGIRSALKPVDSVVHPVEAASLRDTPQYAWKIDSRNYILGRPGYLADHLGPVVAESPEAAQLLVRHVMALNPEKTFILDVPEPLDWARSIGFTERRELIRMGKGACEAPPPPYAIIGPEFG